MSDDNGKDFNANHRDGKGRFVKGCKGGPGNPHVKRSRAFEVAAREAVEPEVLAAIMRKAASLALNGDVQAMKFVADRLLGKPKQIVEMEGSVEMTIATVQSGLEKLADRLGGVSLN